jgi:hypothetical protein
LSGNATLWNDGKMQNVTSFVYPPEGESKNAVTQSSSDASTNSAQSSFGSCIGGLGLSFSAILAFFILL